MIKRNTETAGRGLMLQAQYSKIHIFSVELALNFP